MTVTGKRLGFNGFGFSGVITFSMVVIVVIIAVIVMMTDFDWLWIEGTRGGHRRFKGFTCCFKRRRAPVSWPSSSSDGATTRTCSGWPTPCSASAPPYASSACPCPSKDGPALHLSLRPALWAASAAALITTATTARWRAIISIPSRARPVIRNASRSSYLLRPHPVNGYFLTFVYGSDVLALGVTNVLFNRQHKWEDFSRVGARITLE